MKTYSRNGRSLKQLFLPRLKKMNGWLDDGVDWLAARSEEVALASRDPTAWRVIPGPDLVYGPKQRALDFARKALAVLWALLVFIPLLIVVAGLVVLFQHDIKRGRVQFVESMAQSTLDPFMNAVGRFLLAPMLGSDAD